MDGMGGPGISARRALAVAACGGLLWLVALIFDAAPLLVPAVALTALGLLAPVWVWTAARGAGGRRHLTTERVVEGQPFRATIDVRRGWLALARVQVLDPFTGSRFDVAEVKTLQDGSRHGRHVSVRVSGRVTRRGLHRLPPPSLIISDALELATVRRPAAGGERELLVLPATERVRWTTGAHGRRLRRPDGEDGADALAAVDLDGLRPYRPGTPASRIHWPAVARGRGLLERRLRADGDSRPLVVLDLRVPAPTVPATTVDAAVRAAASLAVELARGGGCGLLLPGEHRPTMIDRELAAWPAAHARLALAQGTVGGRGPGLGTGRAGAMIYVAAASGERLGAQLAVAGGRTILVVPEDSLVDGRPRGVRGPTLAALSVSGCRGFMLGAGREAVPAGPPDASMETVP